MKLFYFALASFFILGSYTEYRLTAKGNRQYYSIPDFKSSLQLMFTGMILDLAINAAVIYLFLWISPYALFELGYKWWVWLLCYVVWDLIFYCKHYLEHNVRLLWAIHVNHHSSDFMNLSTSLRSGVLKSTYRYFFWLIIIIIGFPVPMFLTIYGVGKLWAFFSHSQKLGRWGIFEKFTVTPTHHLLHHSCNEDNLNRNFGETLLIWDKLFGTFKENAGSLRYGISEPVNHHDFADVIFHEFKSIRKDISVSSGWKEKIRVVFGKPGYHPSQGPPHP